MKNIIPFLRYIIDPRKFKSVIILAQCFALTLLVGCRSQMRIDQVKYEAQAADLVTQYTAEIAALTEAEKGTDVTYQLPGEHADEAALLAKMLYPYRNNSAEDQTVACWCVFNRVESAQYPDTVEEVIRQPQQWMGYSDDNPVLGDLYAVAQAELTRWYSESIRPMSAEYVFMSWSEEEIVLRDSFEESKKTHYWRA